MLDLMGVSYTLVQDASDQYDTPSDGEFRMYYGGTTLADTAEALHSKVTVSMQHYCTRKVLDYRADKGVQEPRVDIRSESARRDEFVQKIADLAASKSPRRSRSNAVAC